jgi:hypothetical protein
MNASVCLEIPYLDGCVSGRTGAEARVRKKKSRWEEPSPSTALALSHVPKEIVLPGGIKVLHLASDMKWARASRSCEATPSLPIVGLTPQLGPCHSQSYLMW